MQLAVRQEQDALAGRDCLAACGQAFVGELVVVVFLHLPFKVLLIPLLLSEGQEQPLTRGVIIKDNILLFCFGCTLLISVVSIK